jgi:site-specific DNA-methyltransferase (adenine-specific)
MKGMADKSVDLIICDLPFGCLSSPRASIGAGWREVKKNGGTPELIRESPTNCSWDIKIDLELFWKEIKRIRKNDHTPCLMFCTTKYGYELIKSNEKEFRYDLVWDKQRGVSFLSANKMPMRSHEMIYVFSKAGAKYNRVDLLGDYPKSIAKNTKKTIQGDVLPNKLIDNTGKRCVLSIIKSDGYDTRHKGQHPTAKPIDLYKFLIERYSDAGDTVLDPTFGSGNSGLASIELRRKYIGIEKDSTFFWKAVKKLAV